MHVPASRGLACLLLLAGPLPAAAPPGPDPAAKARAVLLRHCASCHGEQARPKGGLGHITDLPSLLSRGQVVAGDPARSPLYQRLADGEMPPPGKAGAFSRADREAVRGWIAAGAPVHEATPARASRRELRRLIAADLEALPTRDQRFARYLTLGHHPAERAALRHAVVKLVNSLSWHARLSEPVALANGLAYRLDLRHYRWPARQWDRLAARDPYADEDEALARLAGAPRPVLRADWFVATASRPPAYHDLLGLPATDGALERLLQVDRDEQPAARAGFNGSGVARANRVLERLDALHGAYWRSYDFSDNTGRQNLFAFPLGPSPGPAGFQPAGGEVIFHLPNGLQAYLLVDGEGRRIDTAPGEIVSDPNRPDRLVENGLSCIGCHASGILPKDDQVRAHVLKNPRAFDADLRDDILALYVPARRMRGLVKEDNDRFARALSRLGVPAGEPEPVLAAVLRHERTVDLGRAADELDVSPDELAGHLRRAPELARALGPLLASGSVQRQVFEEVFARLRRSLPAPAGEVAKTTWPIRDHRETIRALAWSPSGGFASADAGGFVRLFDARSGTSRELGRHREDTSLAFSADGSRLLTGGTDRVVLVWDVRWNRPPVKLVGHTAGVRAVAFAGRWAVSGSEDRTLRIWNVTDGSERHLLTGHTAAVTALAVSPDGKHVLSASSDRTVRLWDAEAGKPLLRLEHAGEARAITFTSDGKHFASAARGELVIRDVARGAVVRRITGLPEGVLALAFTDDGKTILSAARGEETLLHAHDVATGKPSRRAGRGRADVVALNRQGDALVGRESEIHLERITPPQPGGER